MLRVLLVIKALKDEWYIVCWYKGLEIFLCIIIYCMSAPFLPIESTQIYDNCLLLCKYAARHRMCMSNCIESLLLLSALSARL